MWLALQTLPFAVVPRYHGHPREDASMNHPGTPPAPGAVRRLTFESATADSVYFEGTDDALLPAFITP
jgi:hypothetical protein